MPPLSDKNITPDNQARVNQILEVIIAYARLDFSQKTTILGSNDVLDAIGAGVNMLGEELETSTISLKEKEQLLKEIHHRVKNNLQIISSLLNLQSENITDPAYLNMILGSKNRINSMALVHEMLYSSKDLSRIELSEYIKRLVKNIHFTLAKPDSEIIINYEMRESFFFDIDRMIPLGLILNEIITNSIKYAFPEQRGKIDVRMKRMDSKICLQVCDNGVGFPKNFDFERDGHLGLQLIKMLTEQMDGTMEVITSSGTSYKILFDKD